MKEDIFVNYKNQVGLVSFILLCINSYQLNVIGLKTISYLCLIIAFFSGCADSYMFSNMYTRIIDKLFIIITILFYTIKTKGSDKLFNCIVLSWIFPLLYSKMSVTRTQWVFRHHLWHCYLFISITGYVTYKLTLIK